MSDRTVHVGNLEGFVNESTLYLIFSQFGAITNVRFAGDPKFNTRYAFVEFADAAMAHSACLLDGLQVGARNIKVAMSKAPGQGQGAVSQARPAGMPVMSGGRQTTMEDRERMSRTVHIRGIDGMINEAYLVQFFSVCGPITAARMSGASSPKVGWLEFALQEGAIAALALDNQQLGAHVLRVSPSKTAIQTNALASAGQRDQVALQLHLASQGIAQALQALPLAQMTLPMSLAPSPAIKVSGLSEEATEEDVRKFFDSACGKVRSVAMHEERKAGARAKEDGAATNQEPGQKETREAQAKEDGGDAKREAKDGVGAPQSSAVKRFSIVEFESEASQAAALKLHSPEIKGAAVKIEKVSPAPPPAAALSPSASGSAQLLQSMGATAALPLSAAGLPPTPSLAQLPAGAKPAGGLEWTAAALAGVPVDYNLLSTPGLYGAGVPLGVQQPSAAALVSHEKPSSDHDTPEKRQRTS